jgi:signal transduction histidine kinase
MTGILARRRAWLAAIGGVALLFGPLATYQLTLTAPRSPALLLADLAVGWSMIAAGLLICDRRPGNRIGPLAVATGFVWFAGDFTSASSAIVAYVATVFHGWFDPLFAILILAYPTGRLVRPLDRWLAMGFVVVQAGWTLAKAYALRPIAWWDCPTCIDTVDAQIAALTTLETIGRIETLALTTLSLGVLVAIATRWVAASGAARRRQAPVVLASIVLVLGFTGGFLVQSIVPTDARTPFGELRVIVMAVLRVLVAVALLIGILRDDAGAARIARLVVRLDGLPTTAVLQDSLREALADPGLEVFRWDPGRTGFTNALGELVEPPIDRPERAVLTIAAASGPLLAIAHDPVLKEDAGLVSAAVAAVRLSAENDRLQAEVRTQLADVRASRARLAEAQETERRRLERNLHDGAQQRLVSLRISLDLLRRRMGPEADADTLAELDAATAEARAAIAELRDLAQGLHPAVLAEAGLGRALESLADRSTVPVTVETDLDGRLPPTIEATAYFVAAEALTNTAKHADASASTIRARRINDRLVLEIADDGRGGADIDRGSGLRGLEDRVTALGGTLRISSPPGGGTVVAMDLPCASS